jgi:hypothetical protein
VREDAEDDISGRQHRLYFFPGPLRLRPYSGIHRSWSMIKDFIKDDIFIMIFTWSRSTNHDEQIWSLIGPINGFCWKKNTWFSDTFSVRRAKKLYTAQRGTYSCMLKWKYHCVRCAEKVIKISYQLINQSDTFVLLHCTSHNWQKNVFREDAQFHCSGNTVRTVTIRRFSSLNVFSKTHSFIQW